MRRTALTSRGGDNAHRSMGFPPQSDLVRGSVARCHSPRQDFCKELIGGDPEIGAIGKIVVCSPCCGLETGLVALMEVWSLAHW